jgi:hypothetical protein
MVDRCLACRGPKRLACALGRLCVGVHLDRVCFESVGVDPRADPVKLVV